MKNLLSKNKSDITDITKINYEIVDVDTNAGSYARLGWIIVIFGVLGFLIWASIAPLDRGVPLSGTLSVAGNRKAVQHQIGGIVDEIFVKEGDKVKAGTVLVQMNDTTAKTNADISRTQLYAALASEARLLAERSGASKIQFSKILLDKKDNIAISNSMTLQQQLFASRQGSLHSELAALEENVSGLKQQQIALQESMSNKKDQAKSLKEQLDSMRELAKDGFVPKNRMFEVERAYSQLNSSITDDIGNIGRVSGQIAEAKIRMIQRKQTYQSEVNSQLADVQKEAVALTSRLNTLDFELSNVKVKAPVDGTVVSLNVFTKGGVIPSGFKLMEIVPEDEPLIIEAMLPVNLVDKVHPGLNVELIFSAFNTNTTPHIPGIITHVGADRIVDEHTGHPFYKVKASVTPAGQKLLAKHEVRPGMPVELFVKTGERTMMNYLLKPLLDRSHSAMREE